MVDTTALSGVRVINISKSFSGLQALSKVSLTVPTGIIWGLIGPNGSGKTTLLNVISGVLPPDNGEVWLNNTNITALASDRIARLGIARTFQTIRLFKRLTVSENVEAGVMAVERGGIDQRVAGLLERFGLTEWASTPAGALPYGIQRRLEIARALGTRPKILLLDEPAAGLNESESEALLNVIQGVRSDSEYGCGMLVIDHDLRLIMRLCDQIHVLNEGRTIAAGTPQEVRNHPAVIEAYLGHQDQALP
ncbi:MAG: ABC transporter ATP-binding protein [Anaerolineae bacterium]|nr:ABC transporter ATP-binding protein [Anaerolineae bacterium]